jgi:hypothetical protein
MPITYSIDSQRDVIFELWSGDVSAVDLGEYWKRFLADPRVMACRKTLVDLRGCNICFTGAELSHLVETIVLPILGDQDWTTAIVVESRVQYGVARQYHVFAEHYSRDAIFFEPDAALAWLLRTR